MIAPVRLACWGAAVRSSSGVPALRHSSTVSRGGGLRSTLPSTSTPESSSALRAKLSKDDDDGDRGYLAFTKSSLFKLTLPLQPPSSNVNSTRSKASSAFAKSKLRESEGLEAEKGETKREAEESSVEKSEPWELRADAGERVSQIDPQSGPKASGGALSKKKSKKDSANPQQRLTLHEPEMGEPADDEAIEFDAKAPAHSVVFLLHSGQPLSYISSLIEAEGPGFGSQSSVPPQQITFHSRSTDSKRWSPATSIGDFLQDAARIGSFAIRLQPPKKVEHNEPAEVEVRNIQVSVPSFEDRTRYLRSSLYAKTARIETMAKLKAECDALARTTTRRFAIAGGVGLLGWWVTIFSITFFSSYGWDLAEPVTYLCGTAALMVGYTWFLVHNREVSYRAVLSETTTRRQQKLYIDKGFNIERYEELIDECKELRKHIRKVASDYDLDYDQSNSSSGHYKRAIEIVQKREAQEQQTRSVKSDEEEEEDRNKEKDKTTEGSNEEEVEEKKSKS